MNEPLRFEFMNEAGRKDKWLNFTYELEQSDLVSTDELEAEYNSAVCFLTFQNGLSFEGEAQVRRVAEHHPFALHNVIEVIGGLP